MAWGLFKKIKNAIKKAAAWIKNNGKEVVKPLLNTTVKLAPAISTAVAASQGLPPQSGYAIGKGIQMVGNSLGLG